MRKIAAAPCYTSAQLARLLPPAGSAYTLDHVLGVFEEITIISFEYKHSLVVDRSKVVLKWGKRI